MLKRRLLETVGMLMIGDGLLAAVDPQGHARVWHSGPAWWRRAMKVFTDSPALMRGIGVAGAAAGLWLAHRQHGA